MKQKDTYFFQDVKFHFYNIKLWYRRSSHVDMYTDLFSDYKLSTINGLKSTIIHNGVPICFELPWMNKNNHPVISLCEMIFHRIYFLRPT